MVKLLEQAFLDAGTANTSPAELVKIVTPYLTAEGSSGIEITSSLLESIQHYLEETCKSATADSIILILNIQKIAENKELLLPLLEKCSSILDGGSPGDTERIINAFSPQSIPESELSILEKIAETDIRNQVLLAHVYSRSGILRNGFLESIDWKLVDPTEAKSIVSEYAGPRNDPKALEALKIISDHLGKETWLRILGLKLIGTGEGDRTSFLEGFNFSDLKGCAICVICVVKVYQSPEFHVQKIAENKELLLPLVEKCSSIFDGGSPSDTERIINAFSPQSIPERELPILEKIAETGVQNQVLLAHVYSRSGILRNDFLESIDWKLVDPTEAKTIVLKYAGSTNDPKALEALRIISDHLGKETWLRILGLKLIGTGDGDRTSFLEGFDFSDLLNVKDENY